MEENEKQKVSSPRQSRQIWHMVILGIRSLLGNPLYSCILRSLVVTIDSLLPSDFIEADVEYALLSYCA